jgi:hypothetical protein
MSKERPDHHDAELVLRVYETRREAVMRESRRAIFANFWPKTFDDVAAVMKSDHPLNAAFRQVGTYWEMVYAMVKHGIVNAEYFLETNGEGLFVFARLEPFLEEYRKLGSPNAFRNAEWITKECPEGRRLYEVIKERTRKIAASR